MRLLRRCWAARDGRRAGREEKKRGLNYNGFQYSGGHAHGQRAAPRAREDKARPGLPKAPPETFDSPMTRSPIAALTLAAGLLCLLPAVASSAEEKPAAVSFSAASRLADAGQTEQALRLVETALKTRPRDPQWRFLQGTLLSRGQRTDEAIAVFTALTEDYPNLPEPHNNLAVLLAAKGQTSQARAELEAALRADPAYATAHENLGDLQLRIGLESYERALAAGGDAASLNRRIKLLRQWLQEGSAAAAPPPSGKR